MFCTNAVHGKLHLAVEGPKHHLASRERNNFGTALAITFAIANLILGFVTVLLGFLSYAIMVEYSFEVLPVNHVDFFFAAVTLLLSSGVFVAIVVGPWLVRPYVWAKALPWIGFGLVHMVQFIIEASRNDSHLLPYHGGRIFNLCFSAYYMLWYLLYAFVEPTRPLKETFKSERTLRDGYMPFKQHASQTPVNQSTLVKPQATV